MKCYCPDCNNTIPYWREEKGIITCSKQCSNAWIHVPRLLREKIKGEKYNIKK